MAQYISSSAQWQPQQRGLMVGGDDAKADSKEGVSSSSGVTMHAEFTADASALSVNITIAAAVLTTNDESSSVAPPPYILRLRLPGWAVMEHSSIAVSHGDGSGGGVPVSLPSSGGPSWVEIALKNSSSSSSSSSSSTARSTAHRAAAAAATAPLPTVVRARFGMGAWLSMINDNRSQYRTMATMMWGPLVLAGLTERNHSLCVDAAQVKQWLTPDTGVAATAAAASAASSRYLWRIGALAQGDDLGARNVTTLAQAEAHCDELGSACTGFTYAGPRVWPTTLLRPAGSIQVLFKADTAANRSGWDLDKTWSSWLKVEKASKPVGRVLEFTAKGQDGNSFTLRPLNRMVDESYAVYFNLTTAGC